MSLLEAKLLENRQWKRVGDNYAVTKKSRALDASSFLEIPFTPMESIPQGGDFNARYVMKPFSAITSGTYFEKNDLLIAKITPSFENGKQSLAENLPAAFGYATTEVIPLHPINEKQDRRLLFFYLLHPDIRSYIAEKMEGTTGRQRVPESVLLDLPFPEIEPDEQKTIADILSLIQQGIKKELAAQAACCELKRATMRELFTHGLRGEVQKETEIGLVPESWNVVDFASVREWLQYGTSVRCSLEPNSYPVLRIPNIEQSRVDVEELKYCDLSSREAENYRLENGDMIFIRTNGVLERLGSCAVYAGDPPNALFASYLIRARVLRDIVEPRFAAYFFGSKRGIDLIAGRATPAADGKYNLNTGTIDSIPLPLPPTLDEQREVVGILDAIDRKIDLHKRKKSILEELFKSLLHKLMTGEIRVTDLDLSALEIVKTGAAA